MPLLEQKELIILHCEIRVSIRQIVMSGDSMLDFCPFFYGATSQTGDVSSKGHRAIAKAA